MVGLVLVYANVLAINVLSTARQFIAHTRDRIELREQGEIIRLLREFEASGSGGLWELDSDLCIVKMSTELLQSIGRNNEDEVIGRHYSWLLDPAGQIVGLSTGMRSLFHDLEHGVQFRDRAIPSADRKRWWSLSGKPILDERGLLLGWRGVASDITDARLSGDDAVRAARTDPLTGLANRLLVRELLEEAVMRQSEELGQCALLLLFGMAPSIATTSRALRTRSSRTSRRAFRSERPRCMWAQPSASPYAPPTDRARSS
jgi:GGDEF domain-containing protein